MSVAYPVSDIIICIADEVSVVVALPDEPRLRRGKGPNLVVLDLIRESASSRPA